jgi:hypothetical protein
MGISWAFYAFATQGDAVPSVFGLTAPVVKILSQEAPEDVFFENGTWQDWMFSWIRKNMQAHRYFDATRFAIVAKWPESPSESNNAPLVEEPVNVYDTKPNPPKRRGRPSKKRND